MSITLTNLIDWHHRRAQSVLTEKDCCEKCAQGKAKFHNEAAALLESCVIWPRKFRSENISLNGTKCIVRGTLERDGNVSIDHVTFELPKDPFGPDTEGRN